ncbi:MAG: acetoacetate--CoA ligase [Chitinophagales bacterium]|nr:acetoacetate--CoA ligase [Hyphomicrobiales bacterium]
MHNEYGERRLRATRKGKFVTNPLWQPPHPERTNMARFAQGFGIVGGGEEIAADLHRFSLANADSFWSGLWNFCNVVGDKGPEPFIQNAKMMPGAAFFPAASLNFAENLLRQRDDLPAIVFWGENKVKTKLSHSELYAQVAAIRQFLVNAGVGPGDRVAAMVPNMPQAVAGMLAASSIGAVWSSCSPDFGVQGVVDRFGQIEPKVFLVCDGYYYAGKTIHVGEKAEAILLGLPTVAATIIIDYIGEADALALQLPGGVTWEVAAATPVPVDIAFARLPFSHPLYILYSSGTTGVPKCIVHSAGGMLLQHLKEHQLHCDVRPGDKLFYFSTCGWMMWNWLVSGLASGATLLLYDGSPTHPDANILFDYADAEGMTHFGTSAKYIDALKKQGLRPRDTHSLASVRMMASTGSPLVPESFDYVYENIKSQIHLASVSGGTDICSCFVIGNPLLPVWRGEIQGPGLGMAVKVVNEAGQPIRAGKGELVCTAPFPAMPIGFWNDPDGLKYRGAYFERFDNVWHHGDFAEWTEHGGIIIHGRSDATLNPGGVRIGTAEIYRQVEQLPEVRESIVIGQDWDNDVRVVLFVVLREGLTLDDEMRASIKRRIREGGSPRHVPAVIVQVPDIPRTKSGKITEIAVRDIISGREVKNKEALANPEALDHFRGLGELAS